MADVGIRVSGIRELRRALKAAGADLADLKALHADTARVVVPVAQARAPRRTGRLAASTRFGASVSATTIKAGTARVPYAAPIHWGWGRRGIRANPWLSQAAQATEPTWTALYEERLADVIETITKAANT